VGAGVAVVTQGVDVGADRIVEVEGVEGRIEGCCGKSAVFVEMTSTLVAILNHITLGSGVFFQEPDAGVFTGRRAVGKQGVAGTIVGQIAAIGLALKIIVSVGQGIDGVHRHLIRASAAGFTQGMSDGVGGALLHVVQWETIGCGASIPQPVSFRVQCLGVEYQAVTGLNVDGTLVRRVFMAQGWQEAGAVDGHQPKGETRHGSAALAGNGGSGRRPKLGTGFVAVLDGDAVGAFFAQDFITVPGGVIHVGAEAGVFRQKSRGRFGTDFITSGCVFEQGPNLIAGISLVGVDRGGAAVVGQELTGGRVDQVVVSVWLIIE